MTFCTGCGKSLEDGVRFCTNCGIRVKAEGSATAPPTSTAIPAAVAAAPAVEPTQPQLSPTPSPDYSTPVAASSPNSAFVVIICVILLVLIGGAVSAAMYIRNQRAPKAAAEREEAGQQLSSEDSYLKALNLGSYPGATPVAIVTLNGETVVAGFVTRDRPEQVMQYYKVRFPISELTTDTAGAHLSATLPNQQRIRIDASPQGTATQVKIVRAQ